MLWGACSIWARPHPQGCCPHLPRPSQGRPSTSTAYCSRTQGSLTDSQKCSDPADGPVSWSWTRHWQRNKSGQLPSLLCRALAIERRFSLQRYESDVWLSCVRGERQARSISWTQAYRWISDYGSSWAHGCTCRAKWPTLGRHCLGHSPHIRNRFGAVGRNCSECGGRHAILLLTCTTRSRLVLRQSRERLHWASWFRTLNVHQPGALTLPRMSDAIGCSCCHACFRRSHLSFRAQWSW